MYDANEPVYMISVVAKMLDIHPQTLRQYEKEGLIKPQRTQGEVRLYSQNDIELIKMILRLTRELGVNIAGVDLVLKLKNKIELMNDEINKLKAQLSKKRSTNNIVPNEKSIVAKDIYDVILFDKKKPD